jgi:hypothetical protein
LIPRKPGRNWVDEIIIIGASIFHGFIFLTMDFFASLRTYQITNLSYFGHKPQVQFSSKDFDNSIKDVMTGTADKLNNRVHPYMKLGLVDVANDTFFGNKPATEQH